MGDAGRSAAPVGAPRAGWRAYVELARPDHWSKNVFVLPGVVAAVGLDPTVGAAGAARHLPLGLAATCLVASSNYVLNELVDAPRDRHHPTKRLRPLASRRLRPGGAVVEWIALGVAGVSLGAAVTPLLAAALGVLWVMGLVYNVPPVRSKELPHLDVLSEALNNPIRMLAGWWMAGSVLVPPASLLLAYWMVGAYFMALKRLCEVRAIADPRRAAAYRRSLGYYDEGRLLVASAFYGCAAMLFVGAFATRYRLELVLSFPLVAWVMAAYLEVALRPDSGAAEPEKLWREGRLMLAVASCAAVMSWLMWQDLPVLGRLLSPTVPALSG